MTAWTEHVKAFAKEHNISYPCAISMPACMDSYKGVIRGAKPFRRAKPKPKVAQPKPKVYSAEDKTAIREMVEDARQALEEAEADAETDPAGFRIFKKKMEGVIETGLKSLAKPYSPKPKKVYLLKAPKAEIKFTPLEEYIPTEIIQKKITIQRPAPTPAPENIKPVVNRIEEKVKEFEQLGREKLAVDYEPDWLISEIAFVNLMKKYGGNCIPAGIETRIGLHLNFLNKDPGFYLSSASFIKKFGESLKDCIQRGVSAICIPLGLVYPDDPNDKMSGGAGHANMLVYRPFQRIVERFDPNGSQLPGSRTTNRGINELLIQLFEKNLTPWIGEVSFRDPAETCPMTFGFQHLEGHLEGIAEREGGGFCAMWSIFFVEMVILNPDKPTRDILAEVLDITKRDKHYLKSVIRGYVLDVEKGLDCLLKMLGKPGFNFNLKENKGANILKNSKDALDAWLLSTIAEVSQRSFPMQDFAPLPGKGEMRKLKDKIFPYRKKLNRLTPGQLQTIVYFYEDKKFDEFDKKDARIDYIIDGYVTRRFNGSGGLDDLAIIFEKELYKKRNKGLAKSGYFLKFIPLEEYIPNEIIQKKITIKPIQKPATAAEIKAFREKTKKDQKVYEGKEKQYTAEVIKKFKKEQEKKEKEKEKAAKPKKFKIKKADKEWFDYLLGQSVVEPEEVLFLLGKSVEELKQLSESMGLPPPAGLHNYRYSWADGILRSKYPTRFHAQMKKYGLTQPELTHTYYSLNLKPLQELAHSIGADTPPDYALDIREFWIDEILKKQYGK